MHERWHRSNSQLPAPDLKDIMEENPVFNMGKKHSPEHQHHPEFTQSSYLRLRSMEEAFLMKNYFERTKSQSKSSGCLTEHLRSYGI